MTTLEICKAAKAASRELPKIETQKIDLALSLMAEELLLSKTEILLANEKDIEIAKESISPVMIDRLRLNEERLVSMAKGILDIKALPSPLSRVLGTTVREDGLEIKKVSVPLGVVAIIYESRPNVTSDAAALALKSGNACVLKCGKEAHNSSLAIVKALRRGLFLAGVPENAVCLLSDTTRTGANELMRARGLVDLLIPRGGRGLIQSCVENATVPCLETGTGICHVYVDRAANLDIALSVLENAKTSRPSVCNACEVCLVHRDIASEFLPRLEALLTSGQSEKGKTPVELILDQEAAKLIKGTAAVKDSFDTEFLDYKLAIKVVSSIEEATEHIAAHSTSHSEAIITSDDESADYFTSTVDSAAVYVNASTRFTDGGEFGLGCEMGISTQKLHARGPVGLSELTTYKYVITGNGHIR